MTQVGPNHTVFKIYENRPTTLLGDNLLRTANNGTPPLLARMYPRKLFQQQKQNYTIAFDFREKLETSMQ